MIVYFERPEVPGKLAFRCDRLRATLSVDSCTRMWRQANHENVERLGQCKSCPAGAVHAGETAASMSPLMGQCVCARCHRTAIRLIGKHLCVSCWNRQREWILGKNSKGSKPTKMGPLLRRSIRYRKGDESAVKELDLSASITELVVSVLRDSKKSVQFGFYGSQPSNFTQARLF